MPVDVDIGTHFQTGSRVICNPPVVDTDEDYVFIWSAETDKRLRDAGYVVSQEAEGKKYGNSSVLQAYRKGNVNLIAVHNEASYELWYLATRVATKLNLLDKQQRVMLFQLLTEGSIRDTDIELWYNPKPVETFNV